MLTFTKKENNFITIKRIKMAKLLYYYRIERSIRHGEYYCIMYCIQTTHGGTMRGLVSSFLPPQIRTIELYKYRFFHVLFI